MKPAPFAYAAPAALDEVLALLDEHGGDAKPLAGGQSLLPMVNLRLAQPALLVDINRVGALTGVHHEDGAVRIGATTRQLELERTIEPQLPLLPLALAHTGHVATRARGTLGGSLVHADPAGELPAVLIALDGEVIVASAARGERTIAAAGFQTTTMTTSLEEDELLVAVRFPVRRDSHHGFVEIARRHGDFALVGAAVQAEIDADGVYTRVALALFGVADRPVRLHEIEAELVGRPAYDPLVHREVRDAVRSLVRPGDDVHATGEYRRRVAGVAAARALAQAVPSREGALK